MAIYLSKEEYYNLKKDKKFKLGTAGYVYQVEENLAYKIWMLTDALETAIRNRNILDMIKEVQTLDTSGILYKQAAVPLEEIYVENTLRGCTFQYFKEANFVEKLIFQPISLEKEHVIIKEIVQQLKSWHQLGYIRADIHNHNDMYTENIDIEGNVIVHGHMIDLDSSVRQGDRKERGSSSISYPIVMYKEEQEESFQTDNIKEVISFLSILYQWDLESFVREEKMDFDFLAYILTKIKNDVQFTRFMQDLVKNDTKEQIYFDTFLPLFEDAKKLKRERSKLVKVLGGS